MSNTKVMLVTPYFAPKIGGLENYALQLAKNLRTAGFDIVVVTSNHLGKGRREDTVEGLRVIRLPIWKIVSNTPINPLWYLQLKKVIRDEQPDIINAHAPVPGLADLAIRAAGKIPTTLTYHAATLRKEGPLAMQILTRAVERVQKGTFKRANSVVAVSSYVKDSLPEAVQSKTEVVHNAIDAEIIPETPIKRHSKRLIFVGSLDRTHAWKGLDETLQAVRIVRKKQPKVELHVLGDGNARSEYEARADSLGIRKQVVFHGFVQGDEKYQLIKSSSLLVAYPTTTNDAFPTVFPEAWASKTPIIAANIGALGSLINDGEDGILVAPHKPRALANGIVKALGSPSLLKRLADNGYRHVTDSLTWNIVGRQTAELFTRTAARPVAYAANFAIDNSLAPSIHVYEVCQNLQADGRPVTLFAPSLLNAGSAPFAFQQVPMPHFLRPLAPVLYQFKLIPALLRYVRKNNAVIYARQEAFMFAPTVVSKLTGAPLFIETNGIIEEEVLADSRLPLRGLWKRLHLFRAIEGAAYSQASHVFTVTDGLKKYLTGKYNLPTRKVTVVENGINTELMRPLNVTRFAGELRIGFIGHLTPWEGMAYAVTAMQDVVAKLPQAKLIIAGDGEQLPELQRLVAELGLEENVTFLGRIDHGQVPAFLNSCDVCLAYYTTERAGMNSPFKVYEYLACGRPVVVSDMAGLSDHFRGVVVPAKPEDSADLARKLTSLLQDEPRRKQLGEKALAYIRGGHTWRTVAAAINAKITNNTRNSRTRPGTQARSFLTWASGIFAASLAAQFILQNTPLAIAVHLANFGVIFGGLLLAQLKQRRALRVMEWFSLAVGLGLSSMLIVGWLLNTIGLAFGWHTLHSTPVIATFYALEVLLLARAWLRSNSAVLPRAKHIATTWRTWIPFAFPLAAAFGAERLNNNAGGELAIGTLVAILLWQAYLLASRRTLKSSEIMSNLWATSAALLLSVALRSSHLIGYDIHQEFQVFTTVLNNGIWQPNAVHNTYNACLSITILPTMLVHLLHIPAEYIFKFAMQLFVSIVPVLVYKIARSLTKMPRKLALVSALFFTLQLQYVMQFPALIRQEVAFIFFGLLFMVATVEAFSKNVRKMLLVVFGMCMVVSHYSTSIVGLSLLAIAFALAYSAPKVWKTLQARRLADQTGVHLTLRPLIVAFLMLFGFLWYSQLSNATGSISHKVTNGLHHLTDVQGIKDAFLHGGRSTFVNNTFSANRSGSGDFSVSKLEKQNLSKHAYSQDIYKQYPTIPAEERGAKATNTIGKLTLLVSRVGVPALVKLAFIAGVIAVVLLAVRGGATVEFGALALAATAMLLTLTVVPFISDKYNLDRLYQQLIVVLAAMPVLGLQAVLRKRFAAWVLPVAGTLVIAYGTATTGLVNQIGFRAGDINLSGNNETYSRYYTTDADVSALRWLEAAKNPRGVINFDRYTRLNAYAYTPNMSTHVAVPTVLPGRVEPSFYVYRSAVNAETGTAYTKYNDTAAGFVYPTAFVNNYKDAIYSGGGATIYK
ncbi:MAG TPA: glycosyltransferase [Candidatus Saccharimonadales bacterium]|nr:glycosyltransferase [Candidatus Saccharimonadales bacterium]